MDGTRRAVIVGVNEYENDKNVPLSGAVLDATEICDILRDNDNFEIPPKHFLLNRGANAAAMRAAISDLFWKRDECEIALFYFSGHGKKDHLGHGYLLPHDADPFAPFVNGIRIQELKELFLGSRGPKTGIMILDCCYSGIATERGGGSDNDDHIKSFHHDLEIGSPREALKVESNGGGRFILASAGAEKTAREEERQHAGGDKHVHGLFTFHLIEGLLGNTGEAALGDSYSRVSLASLQTYIQQAFRNDVPHRPQFRSNGSTGDDIVLTYSKRVLNQRRAQELAKVRDYIDSGQQIGIMSAIQTLMRLEADGLACAETAAIFGEVEGIITESRDLVGNWWSANLSSIFMEVYVSNKKSWYYQLANRVFENLTLQAIKELSVRDMNFIAQTIERIKAERPPLDTARAITLSDKNRADPVEGQSISSKITTPNPSPSARTLSALQPPRA